MKNTPLIKALLETWQNSVAQMDEAASSHLKKLVMDAPAKEDSADQTQENTVQDNPKMTDSAMCPTAARFTLANVVLPATTANEIKEALIKVKFHELIYQNWGFHTVDPSGAGCVLNFYGPPGTGKSRAAEALAGELAIPFLKVDLAELESKFMGETAKNLRAAFRQANAEKALLFFDEADTVLGKRLASVTQGVDAEINLTRSTMLIEMDGFSGVLVFASNFPENYDSAFRRRISHHIRFDLPDMDARQRLWDMHLPPAIPLVCDSRTELLTRLASVSAGFSGGYVLQTMRLALPMAVNPEQVEKSQLTEAHLLQAIELVKRGLREVGSDVMHKLDETREMYGLRHTDAPNAEVGIQDESIAPISEVSVELISSTIVEN